MASHVIMSSTSAITTFENLLAEKEFNTMHQNLRGGERGSSSNNPLHNLNTTIVNQETNHIDDNDNNSMLITPNFLDGTLVGKERLWSILQTRNITHVNANYWASVPSWNLIVGNIHHSNDEGTNPTNASTNYSPIIYGLESCAVFQERTSSNPSQRRIAPAGLFNTGTNYLSVLLEYNCQNPHRVLKFHGNSKRGHGNEWEVPWGKHTPASFRDKFTKLSRNGKPKYTIEEVLPIVLIRNPYSWMKSMCRNPYTAKWGGMKDAKTCLQLSHTVLGKSADGNNDVREDYDYNTVDVSYGPGVFHYKSLGHLWNDWYREYMYSNTTDSSDGTSPSTLTAFPRLIVRFEDIIFYPLEVVTQICACAGGVIGHRQDDKDVVNGTFHYVVRSAKTGMGHGPTSQRNGLIDSWIRYGSDDPKHGFSVSQTNVADKALDPVIMETFHYG